MEVSLKTKNRTVTGPSNPTSRCVCVSEETKSTSGKRYTQLSVLSSVAYSRQDREAECPPADERAELWGRHTRTHAHAHAHAHVHTHARARTHTCTHARTRTHTCTHTHVHARTRTYTHARAHAHVHTHARTRMHAHVHACTRTCTHAHTRTRAHTRTYTHARAHAHMHTHMRTHTHARDYYSATEKEWNVALAAVWVDLEGVRLNTLSQTEKGG